MSPAAAHLTFFSSLNPSGGVPRLPGAHLLSQHKHRDHLPLLKVPHDMVNGVLMLIRKIGIVRPNREPPELKEASIPPCSLVIFIVGGSCSHEEARALRSRRAGCACPSHGLVLFVGLGEVHTVQCQLHL